MEKESNCREKMEKSAFALCRRFLNWNNFDQFKGESLLIITFNCPGVLTEICRDKLLDKN